MLFFGGGIAFLGGLERLGRVILFARSILLRPVVSVSPGYFGSVLFASALLSVNSPCDLSVSRIARFSVPFRPPVAVSPSRDSFTLPIQVCRLVLGVLVRLGRVIPSPEGDYVCLTMRCCL